MSVIDWTEFLSDCYAKTTPQWYMSDQFVCASQDFYQLTQETVVHMLCCPDWVGAGNTAKTPIE